MDQKQIEKLMSAMEQSNIKRIVLKKEDFEIEIERECGGSMQSSLQAHPPIAHYQTAPHTPTHLPKITSDSHLSSEKIEKPNGIYITSPMVGTFYASPSPEDPHFVKVGDSVSESSVVCIVEAMKVMNEVKAGVSGVIAEILIKNGEPVEFGTPMFRMS